MRLHELRPAPGARTKSKRVGRGIGSGLGKTSGRGQKGQKSRSGGGKGPHFEGGQTPLQRRLPKRGFTNILQVYSEVSSRILIGSRTLHTNDDGGIVRVGPDELDPGNGDIEKALTVKAHGFTKSAAAKIEAAGGKVEVI